MRLLNRPIRWPDVSRGTVAARWRASLVLLLGLLLTGCAVRRVLAGPGRPRRRPTPSRSRKGRELFLVGCAFCHGQNGEGIRSRRDGNQHRPVAGRRRRRRGRLPGRHRPDADGPARARRSRRRTPSTPRRRSPRSRRTSPRSAPARRSPTRPTTASRACPTRSARRPSPAAARSSSPTARPATTSRAPAARCRAAATPPRSAASSRKYIYEAMLTGPQAMDNFSNGNLSPEEKRDIIAYLQSLEDTARLRRVRPRRPRPGERGPVRLAGRHRRLRRLRGLDRRPHHPHARRARSNA